MAPLARFQLKPPVTAIAAAFSPLGLGLDGSAVGRIAVHRRRNCGCLIIRNGDGHSTTGGLIEIYSESGVRCNRFQYRRFPTAVPPGGKLQLTASPASPTASPSGRPDDDAGRARQRRRSHSVRLRGQ